MYKWILRFVLVTPLAWHGVAIVGVGITDFIDCNAVYDGTRTTPHSIEYKYMFNRHLDDLNDW